MVDANYLDARSTGFDRDRWAGLRDAALGQSYRDTGGAHRWAGGRAQASSLALAGHPVRPVPHIQVGATLRRHSYHFQHTSQRLVYALHCRPHRHPRAIRDMLARGLSDPYCRFVPASELAAMKKYDVSGVGLNLGTAREFEVKTVRRAGGLPASAVILAGPRAAPVRAANHNIEAFPTAAIR